MIFLYKTTNLINNKFYYGIHESNNSNDSYLGSGTGIKRAVAKYGENNFSREIIQFFDSKEEAFEFEKNFVTQELVNNPQCYNMNVGGKGGFHHINSIGMNKGANNPMKNPESKNKNIESRKKARENLSEEELENLKKIWMKNLQIAIDKQKGVPKTLETRRKLSEANRGKKLSEETKKKIGLIHKGKKDSSETKEKKRKNAKERYQKSKDNGVDWAANQKGVTRSEETREKMSRASKERWAKRKENGFDKL